jgi:hypothetical protein
MEYICSNCGTPAGYDGRCGDGPYLVCECTSPKNSYYVDEGSRGGYTVYLNDARPVPAGTRPIVRYVSSPSKKDWDDWGRDDD